MRFAPRWLRRAITRAERRVGDAKSRYFQGMREGFNHNISDEEALAALSNARDAHFEWLEALHELSSLRTQLPPARGSEVQLTDLSHRELGALTRRSGRDRVAAKDILGSATMQKNKTADIDLLMRYTAHRSSYGSVLPNDHKEPIT